MTMKQHRKNEEVEVHGRGLADENFIITTRSSSWSTAKAG